jgi:hypothetical protein
VVLFDVHTPGGHDGWLRARAVDTGTSPGRKSDT